MAGKRKRFSELHPICYKISIRKETLKRHIRDLFSGEKFAKTKSKEKLPVVISAFSNHMIKRAPGVDLTSQLNKAENLRLAGERIHGTLIRPGETFSFWHTVGKTTRKKGYKDGRVITDKGLTLGLGGGLCNLGNSINRIVLQSPLTVTEFHKHSDALAPDHENRIPLANGTSVSYNYVDYRFRNDTEQTFQLLTWCADEQLFCELRSDRSVPYSYRFEEEDHHFRREGEAYYRVSKIYLVTSDADGNDIKKELIWDNHSKVMFDPELIPRELIRA